ncbi:MAG: sugar-binding transcriptional regulator [Lachnospiraceae bacterium]|nr:sugar-binding transcriptional regulator [Lachnospiraceae bacterium]
MDVMKSYQIIRVAKKYYELHMGQLEIAKEEGVSKSTISRMLQKAMDLGYIKVKIDAPTESLKTLENDLKGFFHLKEAFVNPNLIDNEEIIMRDTCRALARNLSSYIKDNSTVGVSWGKTMNCLVKEINYINARNIKVVQLNGGVAKSANLTGAAQIVDALTQAGDGIGYMFPVPAIVDSKVISTVLKEDSQVQDVLNLAREAQTTIFSIGALSKQSILYEVGYLKDEDYHVLEEKGAVGDIASRFFDINGKIADENLDERVVGLDLEELKKKEWNIAVAVGNQKVDAIIGALNGGFANVLYTDEKTARLLLEKVNR